MEKVERLKSVASSKRTVCDGGAALRRHNHSGVLRHGARVQNSRYRHQQQRNRAHFGPAEGSRRENDLDKIETYFPLGWV